MKDAYNNAVAQVLARTNYEMRIETAISAGCIVGWSNGSRAWGRYRYSSAKVKRGQAVPLSPNEIIVYGKPREVDKIASHLPALPLDSQSYEEKEHGPEQFLSNPRGQEEEWLGGEESGDPGPTGEGDLAPWMLSGGGGFPMEGKVYYINAYTLVEYRTSIGFKDNLKKYGNSHQVGIMKPDVSIGSDSFYVPFASIPVRHEDLRAKDSFFGYLTWLIKSVNLGFTRIETEQSFPSAEYNQYTGKIESKVTLHDGRWFPFSMDGAFRHPSLEFVNSYTMNRYYGGPEEGGWWYDAGDPIASIPIKREFPATEKKFKDYLKNSVGWHSKYELGSVLGHDNFSLATEDHFAERWPRETPHYE